STRSTTTRRAMVPLLRIWIGWIFRMDDDAGRNISTRARLARVAPITYLSSRDVPQRRCSMDASKIPDRPDVKTAFERNARAMELRDSVGRGTARTHVRLRQDLTCDVEDGRWKLVADMAEKHGSSGE